MKPIRIVLQDARICPRMRAARAVTRTQLRRENATHALLRGKPGSVLTPRRVSSLKCKNIPSESNQATT